MTDSECGEEEDREDVERRHRREKKLLQNKIQALKKCSGKVDKKKKKELEETISEMEAELARTHLEELADFTAETAETSTEDEAERTVKVSKAQKRREKKAAEEAARDLEIAQNANRETPGDVERKAILEVLTRSRLAIHQIPPDGDCLYAAVSHQLATVHGQVLSVAGLRRLAADHVLRHREAFAPFLCDTDTGEPLTEERFHAYCTQMAETKAWGGQVELQALSAVLDCPIRVVQSPGPDVCVEGRSRTDDASAPLVLAYHRHMYGLGEHYNSTRPVLD